MAKKSPPRNSSPLYWSAETWAFISLRFFLGLVFLMGGLGKFKNADSDYSFSAYYDGFCQHVLGLFAETDIPGFLLYLYVYTIGYAEIALGLLLLAGVKTKWILALFTLTFISLAFGQMVLGNHDKVLHIGTYLLFTTAALYFVRHNRYEALR